MSGEFESSAGLSSSVRPSPRKVDAPILWIVAGPNGSGKSTLYGQTAIEDWGGSVWIINPDLLTVRLVEAEGLRLEEANRIALDRMQLWLDASIEVHQTIGVETVLSTNKYRRLVEHAKARGFEVRMLYVILETAALQLERIGIRVDEGGHDVPRQKVIDRRQRSLEQLAIFAKHMDRLMIFDNSTGEPKLIAYKRYKNPLMFLKQPPADMREALVAGLVPSQGLD